MAPRLVLVLLALSTAAAGCAAYRPPRDGKCDAKKPTCLGQMTCDVDRDTGCMVCICERACL